MTAVRLQESCAFCGLPVPGTCGRIEVHRAPSVEQQLNGDSSADSCHLYCCFGCQFAAQVANSNGEAGAVAWLLARLAASIFCTINVTVCTMVLWSRDLYPADDPSRLSESLYQLLRYTATLFAIPVWFSLGHSLSSHAWKEVVRGKFSTDVLFLSAIAAAYASSIYAVIRGDGPVYYEVACVVLVLLTLGRWFEAQGKLEAVSVMDRMQKLLPDSVRRLTNQIEETISAQNIVSGDHLRVVAGERIPTDAILISDRVTLDEQFITGESWPVVKLKGEALPGGALNLDGNIVIRATASVAEGTLARMMDAVRAAREQRGEYEQLASRFASWFTPVVLMIALITLIWHSQTDSWQSASMSALAVLLIACPCALGLATPLAIWAALGRAAERQVLFRSGDALERLAHVRHVAFDKTGTLTTGTPQVVHVEISTGKPRRHVLALAAKMARSSGHPLSLSACRYCDADSHSHHAEVPSVHQVVIEPGKGVQGAFGEEKLVARWGSPQWISESLNNTIENRLYRAISQQKGPEVWLSVGGDLWGRFVFCEALRPDARHAIDKLHQLGLSSVVLTGDHRESARQIGQALSMPVETGLLPAAKQHSIKRIQQQGKVLAVGDGINDAQALSAADVGMSLACGTDIARAAADICLTGNQLERIPWTIQLARETERVIRRNLFWSFGYNAVGVICAALGWMNPMIAAALMTGSSLAVIHNSLKLARFPADLQPGTDIDEFVSKSLRPAEVSAESDSRLPASLLSKEAQCGIGC